MEGRKLEEPFTISESSLTRDISIDNTTQVSSMDNIRTMTTVVAADRCVYICLKTRRYITASEVAEDVFQCGGWSKTFYRGVWGMLRQNMFDLGTPGKPVLSYFPANIPKQWTTSNFLIDFVIHDCCFCIGVRQSLYRKINIKS